jgi:hypothetical protein
MHQVWKSQRADDKLVTEFMDVPHSCGTAIQDKALLFLDKYLKPTGK